MLSVDPLKCILCMGCELACGYHRDEAFTLLSSSIMPYRGKLKKDYFGVIIKTEEGLLVARPEGSEVMGLSSGQGSGGDASAKPLLLRESCDMCEGTEHGPLCVIFCPTSAIALEE